MAVKLSKVRQQVKTLDPLKYGDEELHVSYFVNAYTPRLEEEADQPSDGAGKTLIRMIIPLIAQWDLMCEYPVFQYNKKDEVEPDWAPATEPGKRLFVVNGEGGRIGEWDPEKFEDEHADGERKRFRYELEGVFRNGEQLTEEKVVPVTMQGLLDVPLNVMTDIIKAVGEALSPGEAKSSNSESSFT